MRRLALMAASALLAGGLTACSGSTASDGGPSFESRVKLDTAELRAAKRQARIDPCVEARRVPGGELPDLELADEPLVVVGSLALPFPAFSTL